MKIGKLFLILILVFIVFGCIPRQEEDGGKVSITGRGITMSFREGRPPGDEIRIYPDDEGDFDVVVYLENNAVVPVAGDVYISDKRSSYSSLKGEVSEDFSIEEANLVENRIVPETEDLYFGPFDYNIPDDVKDFIKETTISTRLEIPNYYVDIESVEICIHEYVGEEEKFKIADPRCRDIFVISGEDLGLEALTAPISVTKIEKNADPKKESSEVDVELVIKIEDLGQGKDDGNDRIENFEAFIGGSEIKCFPSTDTNIIYLKDIKKSGVTCRFKEDLGIQTYKILRLDISFDYPYIIKEKIGPIDLVHIQ